VTTFGFDQVVEDHELYQISLKAHIRPHTFRKKWGQTFALQHAISRKRHNKLLSISLINIAAQQRLLREIFVVKLAEPLRK
jgi:hypothetical protein